MCTRKKTLFLGEGPSRTLGTQSMDVRTGKNEPGVNLLFLVARDRKMAMVAPVHIPFYNLIQTGNPEENHILVKMRWPAHT